MTDNEERPEALPKRTIERSRGCWNCVSYDCSERIKEFYKERTQGERGEIVARAAPQLPKITRDNPHVQQIAKRAADFMAQGFSATAATNRALAEVGGGNSLIAQQIHAARQESVRFTMFDRMVICGLIGVCLKGRSESDFVAAAFLCEAWVGKEGASVATEGMPMDKLPEELKDE
jgi:hypothetical protein